MKMLHPTFKQEITRSSDIDKVGRSSAQMSRDFFHTTDHFMITGFGFVRTSKLLWLYADRPVYIVSQKKIVFSVDYRAVKRALSFFLVKNF